MNKTITVILPVYNAEKSIARAIESVLNQQYHDWELLIVDDGSTDGTYAVCSKYAKADNRISVYRQINSGVAAARREGLSRAKGEYVIHLDSDDYMEPTMLNGLIECVDSDDADIVVCDYNIVDCKGAATLKSQAKPFTKKEISGHDLICSILKGEAYGALWNKLIRRTLYKSDEIYFFDGINYSEDVLSLALLLYGTCHKVVYLPRPEYNYTVNDNSITRNWTEKTFENLCRYYSKLASVLPDDEFSSRVKRKLYMGRFSAGFLYGIFERKDIQTEFAKVKDIAFQTKSLRWKLGYLMILFRQYSLARKLLWQ